MTDGTLRLPGRRELEEPQYQPEPVPQQPRDEEPPVDWGRGALLNVCNTGAGYVVTLWPWEYDPRVPASRERALFFANPARLQDFVSRWYARQSHDPRAL